MNIEEFASRYIRKDEEASVGANSTSVTSDVNERAKRPRCDEAEPHQYHDPDAELDNFEASMTQCLPMPSPPKADLEPFKRELEAVRSAVQWRMRSHEICMEAKKKWCDVLKGAGIVYCVGISGFYISREHVYVRYVAIDVEPGTHRPITGANGSLQHYKINGQKPLKLGGGECLKTLSHLPSVFAMVGRTVEANSPSGVKWRNFTSTLSKVITTEDATVPIPRRLVRAMRIVSPGAETENYLSRAFGEIDETLDSGSSWCCVIVGVVVTSEEQEDTFRGSRILKRTTVVRTARNRTWTVSQFSVKEYDRAPLIPNELYGITGLMRDKTGKLGDRVLTANSYAAFLPNTSNRLQKLTPDSEKLRATILSTDVQESDELPLPEITLDADDADSFFS